MEKCEISIDVKNEKQQCPMKTILSTCRFGDNM